MSARVMAGRETMRAICQFTPIDGQIDFSPVALLTLLEERMLEITETTVLLYGEFLLHLHLLLEKLGSLAKHMKFVTVSLRPGTPHIHPPLKQILDAFDATKRTEHGYKNFPPFCIHTAKLQSRPGGPTIFLP